MQRLLKLLAVLGLSACVSQGTAPTPVADRAATAPLSNQIASFPARPAPPPSRPNAQMVQDFRDLAFQMESGRTLPVLTRFEGPISVYLAPGAPMSLSRDLDAVLDRLRREAAINIGRTAQSGAAITIETLPRARLQRIVPQAACFVVPRVSSWAEFRRARTTGALDWTTLTERERVAIFIPNDVAPQEMRDCLHEELGQAIGPLNDLYRLPDSVFNDDNFHAVLTGFDMLILRAYYDPSLQSGMTEAQVMAAMPAIFNRLNPRGRRGAATPAASTPRAWVDLIERALGPSTPETARRSAATDALRFAQSQGWSDTRLGFAYFALGRLSLGHSSIAAIEAFESADLVFSRTAPGSIQSANAKMQLAAFALSVGDWPRALDLVEAAEPAARRGENASLLATLLMIQAEALARLGDGDRPAAIRAEALAWARYGLGDEQAVRTRLGEIAALASN